MNGPPDLPTDAIPMPVPEPAAPMPVAAEPAAEAGAVVGTPAPQPRWVGEAVRNLLTVSRKKLVVLTTAGSVVAVGLALNALFSRAGLAPPETPSEQPAETKSLAAAPETRESPPTATPPAQQPIQPITVPYKAPPDLRTSGPPAAIGVPDPDIPVVPAPVLSAEGAGLAVEPASILPAAHTEPAPTGEIGIPVPTPPVPDPMTPPAKTESKPVNPVAKPLEVAVPAVKPLDIAPPFRLPDPTAIDASAKPDAKKVEPAATLDPKGVQPVTPASEEKKDTGSALPLPPPAPAKEITLPPPAPPIRTTPAAGEVTVPGALPVRVTAAPADGGTLPEPKDVTPAPPSPFKPASAASDGKPDGGSLNLTKPPGEIGVRPTTHLAPPKTDFDVDLHRPKAGDTYESISKLHYRDARYAEALRRFNDGMKLDRGTDVRVPPMYVLRQGYSNLIAPARSSSTPEWAPPAGRERK
ncbi:MAG TPA: hypothetical protein VFG68_12900 [Fimbriiglobus sp.]|nr:hypothetical protein [Fimbriiglobus sp.]